MTQADFETAVTEDLRAAMNNPHPAPDHFTEDDRDWDELSDTEKRAQLAELDHDDLVDLAMQFADDADLWERKARRIAALNKDAFDEVLKLFAKATGAAP